MDKEKLSVCPSSSMGNLAEVTEGGCNPSDDEWKIIEDLEKVRKDPEYCSWETIHICRVPRRLREIAPKAYIPQLVSLGPYHHGDPHLRLMDRHKLRILAHVLKREGKNIKDYLDAVLKLEEKARNFYEGPIDITSCQFVQIMVLDAIFVLEVLHGVTTPNGFTGLGYSTNDIIFSNGGTMHSIVEDMIKLENQLPIFILDQLLTLQSEEHYLQKRIVELVPFLFRSLMPTDRFIIDPSSGEDDLHFLDISRKSLLNMSAKKVKKELDVFETACGCLASKVEDGRAVYCVTELREFGINFKEKKKSPFWDITFNNGILAIPRLKIYDCTRMLFLNLIALEQCHPLCGNKITSYVFFMDSLIDSEQDVVFLRKHKIIEHWLGNDVEVANLFNDLCREVVFDNRSSYLFKLSNKVNQHCKHKWNVWRASLKQKYFYNPWCFIVFMAVVVLLVLNLLQTIYARREYYHS